MTLSRLLDDLLHSTYYGNQVAGVKSLPERKARFATPKRPVHPALFSILETLGIRELYTHQAMALDAVRAGNHVVIVTSTASGKTLCYNIPVLETLLETPGARALYLFPTKALAQDQLRGLLRYREAHPHLPLAAGTYDGDTPPTTRRKLRDEGQIILTNPDMLHSGILPNHTRWGGFFTSLKYIVIDEIHTYRGIFGSNVANVIRRLSRICAHYGASPRFICSSATIANPMELAEKLTGASLTLIGCEHDGSPKGPKSFVLWNPPFLDELMVERRSANSDAQHLMVELIRRRFPTIAFVRTRNGAELLYRYCQEGLQHVSPSLSRMIRAYRGGYLPEERREIERQLFEGELLGVTSTNALELGIDVGGLSACLMVGYPGTIASTWQQAGRAGRGKEESLAVLIAHNTPIDQYLMQNPDYFFGESPENAVIDPDNPYIVLGHLRCAVRELPVDWEDERGFGEYAPAVLDILQESGQVKMLNGRWYWSGTGYPAQISLRNINDNTYTIVDTTADNQVIGSIDEIGAFTQTHTEAVYLHDAETYFVDKLDLTQKIAYVRKADVDYYTQAVTETNIRVDREENERMWNKTGLHFGDVTVTTTVIMFRKIKFGSRDSIGFGNLDLPPQELATNALWMVPSIDTLHLVKGFGRLPVEGMVGIANVIGEVIPLFSMCDVVDIGATVDSSNTGAPTLFVYDKYPGGLGFAQKVYDIVEQVVEGCWTLIRACPCADGCPSCVGSAVPIYVQHGADVEIKGRIPDKEAALVILHDWLGKEPYIPKPVTHARLSTAAPLPPPQPSPREVKPLPEGVEWRIRQRVQTLKRKL
ncbi:MAG: DEAD/DEAH box helicase [candidate division Zixibacteria bacterium]|nr:DEAD/DEAH box helicase [candidate division Zixibacteria bacterium]